MEIKTPSTTLEKLKESASSSLFPSSTESSSASTSMSLLESTESASSSLFGTADSSSSQQISLSSIIQFFFASVLIILFLGLMGINIFVYLAKGTASTTEFIDSMLKLIDVKFGAIFSTIGLYLAQLFIFGYQAGLGTQAAAEFAATTVGTVVGHKAASNLPDTSIKEDASTLQAPPQQQQQEQEQQQQQQSTQAPAYVPSESVSSAGWCYVGEDQGYRSCIQVDSTTPCTSGQVFDSQEKCVNPQLRY